MTIIVIGRTVRSRSRTTCELRRAGHEVVAAPVTRTEVSRTAPLDPGHAGEPLRRLLLRISSLLRHAWLGSRKHAARRRRECSQDRSRLRARARSLSRFPKWESVQCPVR